MISLLAFAISLQLTGYLFELYEHGFLTTLGSDISIRMGVIK